MLTVSFFYGSVENMLIEKRFFDIAKREDEEIKRELEAEKAKMTEEEKLEEKNRHEAEVKELIRIAEARMKKHKKIPDSKKIVEFTLLQKAALEIAEHMGMNIKTEQKKNCQLLFYILTKINKKRAKYV